MSSILHAKILLPENLLDSRDCSYYSSLPCRARSGTVNDCFQLLPVSHELRPAPYQLRGCRCSSVRYRLLQFQQNMKNKWGEHFRRMLEVKEVKVVVLDSGGHFKDYKAFSQRNKRPFT